jgi:hypothetical protein
MGNQFASDKRAIAMCDVCGFQFKLKTLKDLVVKGRNTNIKACQECWNPDQPQLKLGEFPVNDPQAITRIQGPIQVLAYQESIVVETYSGVGTQ